MGYTAKQKSLAILPKLTGTLSFLGSAYILFDVLISPKKRTNSVYHRIVLLLSISDMIASIVNILSTWPIPTNTPNVYGASGSTATCTAQGLFNEMGNIATPLFNASLCTYYYAVIRRGWPEHRIQKIERRFYIPPILVAFLMGFIGLPFQLYNNSGWLCWIAPYPSGCHVKNSIVSCIRGQHASLFRWIHYAIIWGAIFYVTIGMFLIYVEVRNKENRTRRFTVHDSPQMRREMELAIQRAAEEALAEEEENGEGEESDVIQNGGGVHFEEDDDDDISAEEDLVSNESPSGIPSRNVFSDQENQQQQQQEQNMYNDDFVDDNDQNNRNSKKGLCARIKQRRKKQQQQQQNNNSNSQEQYQEERRHRQRQQRKKSKARKVADQAMLFVGALYLTWIFTTLTRIFQITQGKTHYPLLVLMAIFFPLQGFFNASIYLRPRYLRICSAFPKMPFHKVIYYVLKYHDEENVLFLKRGSGRGSGSSNSGGRPSTLRSSSMNSFFNFNSDGGSHGWFSVRLSSAYSNAGRRMSGISRRMSDSSIARRMSGLGIRQMSSGRFSTGSGRFSSKSSEDNTEGGNKKVHNNEIAEVVRRGEEMAREEVEVVGGDRITTIRWEGEEDQDNETNNGATDQPLKGIDIIGSSDEGKNAADEDYHRRHETENGQNGTNRKQEDIYTPSSKSASAIFDDDKHTSIAENDRGKEYIPSKKD